MKKLGYAGLSGALCLAFVLPVLGQAPAAAAANPACDGKARSYYAAPADAKLFADYVDDATCKDSTYRDGAFQQMMKALIDAMKWKDAMSLATRYGKEIPNATAAGKAYVFGQALIAASQAGDADKMIETGETVLSIDPTNLNAMLIVATTIPAANLPADAAAKEKLLNRAMALAKQLVAMAKPAPVDDKTWQLQVVGPAHGVIGFVNLQKAQSDPTLYAQAEDEFDKAVKINPKDQVSWYRYGLAAVKITVAAQALIAPAYAEVNDHLTPGPERDAAVAKRDAIEKDYTDKRDKAMDLFISAVALPDPNIVKAARPTLDSLWKPSHNNSADGLEEAIAARKAELSK